MKQELAWGTAAAMAIVAAVGISSQSGNKPAANPSGKQAGQTAAASKAAKKGASDKSLPQCADAIPLLEHFFLHEKITGPAVCYATLVPPAPLDQKYKTNFIIATLPDPLHTHFSLLFDRLVEAIQQGAQDEGYEYDSSWLPWETGESALALLKDQDDAEERTAKREEQPGILLFRGHSDPYHKALVVFIAGEESTRGIHRAQFENAVAWIKALQPATQVRSSVAILGPSFSGSFPSLADLLAKINAKGTLSPRSDLSIYTGSASSREDGETFAATPGVRFRSFVQDDTTMLDRLCTYFGNSNLSHLAILSEDETAYGSIFASGSFGTVPSGLALYTKGICAGAINLYYPRDISTLRAAYQTQSMFSSGSEISNQDNVQRKSLPTDLADPSGQQHDTVRTYAGNQTSLSQEAQLLGIVEALRAHRVQYVLLRSSSTLDPLFLANFLRRDYPEARIIVLNSDLLFQRGHDALALSGVMTLSTYPLFPWAREWTALPPYDAHSHRVFPENSTEGTYIASRMLLQALVRPGDQKPDLSCELADKDQPVIFAPPLNCHVRDPKKCKSDPSSHSVTLDTPARYAPLPDYAPPFWTDPNACATPSSTSCRPATWLSVITSNGTWPLAALNDQTLSEGATGTFGRRGEDGNHHHKSWPRLSRSTKLLLVGLCCLAVFHLMCCRFASFTAKPAFRAHFATAGRRHTGLVLIGSYLIALMSLLLAWGSGLFAASPSPPEHPWGMWVVVVLVCVATGAAVGVNIPTTRRLNKCPNGLPDVTGRIVVCLVLFAVLIAAFFVFWVWPMEGVLILANRAFVYFRAMNLTNAVSPIVPFLSLVVGLYFWFWYALHGLALFGPDRPCLPKEETLTVQPGAEPLKLRMFSQQTVADPAEKIAKPLSQDNVIVIVILFAAVEVLLFGLGWGVPIRSLGATRGTSYTSIFCVALGFYCSFILAEGWQILRTWSRVRQLLVFLDRLALRRTLSALHGFSWGSVWKMSGNVLDVRYKLLSRQLECLTHLHNSLRFFNPPKEPKEPTEEDKAAFAGIPDCQAAVKDAREEGFKFAKWYTKSYDDKGAADLSDFTRYQEQVAKTTGVVMTKLLMAESRIEKHSLIQVSPDDKSDEEHKSPSPSKNELIRNAEELVCLTYLGFAQNLLGRIRTMVLGGVYMFIALCIAVSSYPFDPRTLLSGILLFLFVALGGVVVFTYADMHRDATLSHVTNTKPGELGSEFWFKVIGYGAAPLLGLITQVFPEWSGFLFSCLQPGLSSLK